MRMPHEVGTNSAVAGNCALAERAKPLGDALHVQCPQALRQLPHAKQKRDDNSTEVRYTFTPELRR